MANKDNRPGVRHNRGSSKRIRRAISLKMQKAKKARLQPQPDHQQEEQDNGNSNGPKLSVNNDTNTDQSIDNLVGYNLGCCPITSRYYKAYLCSKCLLWFHFKCIYLNGKDREAIRNNQWVCYNCKEQVSVIVKLGQNEAKKKMQDEVDKMILEVQNKKKSLALKSIDDLKLKNKALEMKLGDISKWVKDKFGAGADIPEEIETEAEMAFDYIRVLREQYPSFSKIPVIKLNRISGIEDKISVGSEMGNRSLKKDERSHLKNHKYEKERFSKRLFLEKLNIRENMKPRKENKVDYFSSKKTTLPLPPKIFKCPKEKCKKKFRNNTGLKVHIGLIHNRLRLSVQTKLKLPEPLICHQCGKCFKWNHCLQNHIRYVHEKIKRPDQKVICHYCGKSLAGNDSRLRLHIKRVHELGPEIFECPQDNCSKRFASKMRLETHIATHDEPEEYLKCTEEGCLKRFKNKKSLKYHLEIHAAKGVRNFACPMCDKTFMTRNCLAAHKRMSHAKEVNHEFKCTFEGCHLGYSIKRYLEDHLKTHDPNYQPPAKQKLIICQYCAKEYETFPQLNRHILNVHEK